MSFAAITLCVAFQGVFNIATAYFFIDSVRKPLDTPSYACTSIFSISDINWDLYILL
jgi:hypothetical protein